MQLKRMAFFLLLLATGCKGVGDGTLQGIVQTGPSHYTGLIQGIMSATVTVYDASDDSVAAVLITGATAADAGRYSVTLPPGTYRLRYEKEDSPLQGYAPEDYYNVYVPPATTVWLEPVTLVSKDDDEPGGASGAIIDADDGSGVSGATVSLRRGLNLTSGDILYQTTTSAGGVYRFSGLPAGHYSALVTASGYSSTVFSLLIEGGENGGTVIDGQNCALIPFATEYEEVRFVLTWDNTLDLDIILTGPAAARDSAKRFRLDAMNSLYSFDSLVYAQRPMEDTDGYGPESICLYMQTPGVYRLYVHRFLETFDQTDTGLSMSGARVDVYRGGVCTDTFIVPAGSAGNLWSVLDMRRDSVAGLHEISFSASGSALE